MTISASDQNALFADLAKNFDVHDPRMSRCPFDPLAYMRERSPVHRAETYGGHWVVVGYRETAEAARDWRRFSSASGVAIANEKSQKFIPVEYDPPLHQSFRKLLNPLVSQKVALANEPRLRAFADDLIGAFLSRGRAELIDEYAKPLSGYNFFHLLMAMPPEDARFCEAATNDAMFANDDRTRIDGFARIEAFSREALEKRRGQPSDGGIIDAVRTGTVDGRPVTDDEVLGCIQLLIIGGNDSTVHAIGNMFVELGRNPALRDRLKADLTLLPKAVEESLRHQSPAVSIVRTVAEDLELGGKTLKAGDKVMLVWTAANRDGTIFEDADRFDLDRENLNVHVAFGIGPHRCLGERIARSLLEVATERLLIACPDFSIPQDATIDYRMGMSRGPTTVPVTFTPR